MAYRKHIKGDRAELIAAEYFMNLGYSVHRNLSQHGPVDMILLEEEGKGETILVDVKSLSHRTKNGWKVCRTPTKKQKELNVQLVFVDLDKREVLDVLPQKPRKIQAPNVISLKNYRKK